MRVAFTLVLLTLGCAEVVRPQVIVRLDLSAADATRARWIRVRRLDQEGVVQADTTARIGEAPGEVTLPAQVPLTPRGGDPTRRWGIEAFVFEGDAEPGPSDDGFAQLRAQGGYVAETVVELRLRFDASCAGPCSDGQTCSAGRCVGACFNVAADDPSQPICGECEACELAACEPRPGAACGCPSETCGDDGLCGVATPVREVAAGLDATCAILSSGALYCWGNNAERQLGVPGATALDVPTRVDDGPYDTVDVGGYDVAGNTTYGCAVTRNRALRCWGENGGARLGAGAGPFDTPTDVDLGFEAQRVALGCAHTCVTDRSGAMSCIGINGRGELGRGTTGRSETDPAPVMGGLAFVDLGLGHAHTCGVSTGGDVYCWGLNESKQLGLLGDTVNRASPAQVDLGDRHDFVDVAVGAFHGCALREGGEAFCWGGAAFGNLGRPDVEGASEPGPVSLEVPLTELDCGRSHCCGIGPTGELYCWGQNARGQVGVGRTSAGEPLPARVGAALAWEGVDGGERHTCATTTRGELYCWGDNALGQLGLGDRDPRAIPTRVCF